MLAQTLKLPDYSWSVYLVISFNIIIFISMLITSSSVTDFSD